jgi:hypothetical protein
MAVNKKCDVLALTSPLKRRDNQQVPGTLSFMLQHQLDLFLVQV